MELKKKRFMYHVQIHHCKVTIDQVTLNSLSFVSFLHFRAIFLQIIKMCISFATGISMGDEVKKEEL